MEVIEVDSKEYAEVFSKPSHVFNSAAFNAFNANKSEQVYYLIFKDTKVRLGIIFGRKENIVYSPFSAPFSGFETVSNDIRLPQIDAALIALNEWAIEKKFDGIKIVPPCFFYAPNFLNKMYNCLIRAGYDLENTDINHQFPTYKIEEAYQENLWYNAKKNLKKALQYGLTFEKIANKEGELAYDIIAQNRAQRGFPLRMTWEQLSATMDIIPVDVFLVKKEQENIASAFVFHVTDTIVYIVYWGDLPQYSEFKTMNFISYHVFKYYKEQGKVFVDIGISTVESIPNPGLCEFKESIGCDSSIKTEFFKKLN